MDVLCAAEDPNATDKRQLSARRWELDRFCLLGNDWSTGGR